MELRLWTSECFNRVAIRVNDEWNPPREIFYRSRLRLPLLLFLLPAIHRIPQQRKTDPRTPDELFPEFWIKPRAGLLPAPGCGYGEDRLYARLYLAPPENNVHHSDLGCTNRTAEGYLGPHAEVYVRQPAISCTRRRSTSSRTGSDTTAFAYVKLPGSYPLMC